MVGSSSVGIPRSLGPASLGGGPDSTSVGPGHPEAESASACPGLQPAFGVSDSSAVEIEAAAAGVGTVLGPAAGQLQEQRQ
jgi:hypothetical protein